MKSNTYDFSEEHDREVKRNKFSQLPDICRWVFGDSQGVAEYLADIPWISPWFPIKTLDSVLRGIAQVCFANNPVGGAFVLVGLFLGDVNAGIAAVVCSLVAILTAKVLKQPDAIVTSGLTNFSAVLVGTVTATLYSVFFHGDLTSSIWCFMIVASVFSVLIGIGLGGMLSLHNLPAFTLPFNISTAIMFLCLRGAGYHLNVAEDKLDADPLFTNATVDEKAGDVLVGNSSIQIPDVDWRKMWISTVLGAGQVYAVEDVLGSVLIHAGLAVCSPLLSIFCYLGSLIGSFSALLMTSPPYDLIYAGVWAYNGFLASGCFAFFTVLTPKAALVALVNALLATALQAALVPVFALNNLPVFTFPFCLSSLLLLGMATTGNIGLVRLKVEDLSFTEAHIYHYYNATSKCSSSSSSSRESNNCSGNNILGVNDEDPTADETRIKIK